MSTLFVGLLVAVAVLAVLGWFLSRMFRLMNRPLPDQPLGGTGPKEPAVAKRLPAEEIEEEADADAEAKRFRTG